MRLGKSRLNERRLMKWYWIKINSMKWDWIEGDWIKGDEWKEIQRHVLRSCVRNHWTQDWTRVKVKNNLKVIFVYFNYGNKIIITNETINKHNK